jgi:hypothetical protein
MAEGRGRRGEIFLAGWMNWPSRPHYTLRGPDFGTIEKFCKLSSVTIHHAVVRLTDPSHGLLT